MERLLPVVIVTLLSCTVGLADDPSPPDALGWQALAPLPKTLGFGGTFAGVHNRALIVAGGANFPEKPPWEDGKKAWYADIYVLETPKNAFIYGEMP